MNAKQKGNKYERDISKKLSLYLSEGKNTDILWRSNSSGARFTQGKKTNNPASTQDGDIISVAPGISEQFIKKFSVEVKHYKDINLWSIFTKSNTGIIKFLEQVVNTAKKANKLPFLIAKQNNKPELVILEFKSLNIDKLDEYIVFIHNNEKYIVLELDILLNKYSPNEIVNCEVL